MVELDKRVILGILVLVVIIAIVVYVMYGGGKSIQDIVIPPDETGFGDGNQIPPGSAAGLVSNMYRQPVRDASGQVVGGIIWGVTVYDDTTMHLLYILTDGKFDESGLLFKSMNYYGTSGAYKSQVIGAESFRVFNANTKQYESTVNNNPPPLRSVDTNGKINLQIASRMNSDGSYEWEYLHPLIKPGEEESFDTGMSVDPIRSGFYFTNEYRMGQFMVFYKDDKFMVNSKDQMWIWPKVKYIHTLRTLRSGDMIGNLNGEKVWMALGDGVAKIDHYEAGKVFSGGCNSYTVITEREVKCTGNFVGVWYDRVVPQALNLPSFSQSTLQFMSNPQSGCGGEQFRSSMLKWNHAALGQAEGVMGGCHGGMNAPLSRQEYFV